MDDINCKFYNLDNTKALKKEEKAEIDSIGMTKNGDTFIEACGLTADWPKGRGIIKNKENTIVIKINNLDHLEIKFSMENTGLSKFLDRYLSFMSKIEENHHFVKDNKIGYATAMPKQANHFQMSIKLRVGIDLNSGSYRMALGSGVDKFGPKGEKD